MKCYVLTYHEGHRDRLTEVRGVFSSKGDAEKTRADLIKSSNFYPGDFFTIDECVLDTIVE